MTDHPEQLDLSEVRRDLKSYTDGLLYADVNPDASLRCRLLMAVPVLVARIDRVTRERDLLRDKVSSMEKAVSLNQATPVTADPGAVVGRAGRDGDRPESIPMWSARAVLTALQTRWRSHDSRTKS